VKLKDLKIYSLGGVCGLAPFMEDFVLKFTLDENL